MVACTSCGTDVSGKKFCHECGTPVQAVSSPTTMACPRCGGEVRANAAFCLHCGAPLQAVAQTAIGTAQATPTPPPPPATRACPACHATIPNSTAFCTNCGQDTRVPVANQSSQAFCTTCGKQNDPGVRFCGGCGSQIGAPTGGYTSYPAQPQYQSGQYAPQQSQWQSNQYPPQTQYQSYGQPNYPQQYGQPAPYQQGGYQQQPMVVRCPICMAEAPVGTPNCLSCRTNLSNIVPTPASSNYPNQQSGMGGMMQGNGGKYAMGALGGAAAVIGGEILLNEVMDGGLGHHHRHHREGGLGELIDDIGL